MPGPYLKVVMIACSCGRLLSLGAVFAVVCCLFCYFALALVLQKETIYIYIHTMSDFSKIETLKQLNASLADKSYVEGYVCLFL